MFPPHIATKQNCNIQQFNAGSTAWNKPVGVSQVYMLLIGPGGRGSTTVGGGSGGVTVWYGAAQNVPDTLCIAIPTIPDGGTSTEVQYLAATGTRVVILRAAMGGSTGAAGASVARNYFSASGFYTSTAGQAGASGSQGASSTTFLSGGGNGTPESGNQVVANYGYATQGNGYFQLQPIIVGVGAFGNTSSSTKAGIGCGGPPRTGGDFKYSGGGFVLIASW